MGALPALPHYEGQKGLRDQGRASARSVKLSVSRGTWDPHDTIATTL